MLTRDDFLFDLPEHLIAQTPLLERRNSRLLILDKGDNKDTIIRDAQFHQLLDEINENDLVVFNNTKVIPARLFGKKTSGGKIEVLIERLLSDTTCVAHIRSNHSPKVGAILLMEGGFSLRVTKRTGDLFALQLELNDSKRETLLSLLDANGHIPLPPYIEREDNDQDRSRYQTVYAEKPGAVAAPTAGLHFDSAMLDALKEKGVTLAYITLHVGAGTFQPVRENDLSKHRMHEEYIEVSQTVCDDIAHCKASGGRVFAVGTTSLRSLEAASSQGETKPFFGMTRLFILPGYQFNCVDCLITNFHLSGSTLLMLVSAFSGYKKIRSAYQHAIKNNYRFFSYGDAMLIRHDSC